MMITNNISTNELSTIDKILHYNDITSLNQLQIDAINAGLLEEQNFVIALPTGSGKTLLTQLKTEMIINRGQQIIYITPTRTLNDQIYQIFSDNYPQTYNIKGQMSFEKVETALNNFQVLVSTLEKFNIELRKNLNLLDNAGLIIIDEIHLVSDRQRGPIFEYIISLLLFLQEADKWNGNLIGLSGTLHNPEIIAKWMNAAYIHRNQRVIPLQPYIVDVNLDKYDLLLYSKSKESDEFNVSRNLISDLISSPINFDFQSLIFNFSEKYVRIILTCLYLIQQNTRVLVLCSTRRETEFLTRALISVVNDLNLDKLNILYHHAGLSGTLKQRVELLCNNGVYDCVFTTTTFAMGVDYPVDAVILTFLSLFDTLYDWKINVTEQVKKLAISQILVLQQIMGRAGHQEGSSAFVYCLGENHEEGLDIYKYAVSSYPGVQSNFDSYFGKMKFQEFLSAGLSAGWFTDLQNVIDFSSHTLFASTLSNNEIGTEDRQLIETKENIIFDEILDFIINPLVTMKYQNFVLKDKISKFRELIEEVSFEELKIEGKSNFHLLSHNNISPKQIIIFLQDFEKLYNDNRIGLDDLNGIIKLITKTDPNLIIEMFKLSLLSSKETYKDETLQKISNILSSVKIIDLYLSSESSNLKFKKAELTVLKQIRNLLHVFKGVINIGLLHNKLLSKEMITAIPYLKMHITNAFKQIDDLINKN